MSVSKTETDIAPLLLRTDRFRSEAMAPKRPIHVAARILEHACQLGTFPLWHILTRVTVHSRAEHSDVVVRNNNGHENRNVVAKPIDSNSCNFKSILGVLPLPERPPEGGKASPHP